MTEYAIPIGGLPGQHELTTDRAVVTPFYAVIPRGTMRDIVTSILPGWTDTRAWILARPLSGFAETFSQMIVEVAPGGGSDTPEIDPHAESVIFVLNGTLTLMEEDREHRLTEGGYAYLAPTPTYRVRNTGAEPATFMWIRKAYEPAPGLSEPETFVTSDAEVLPVPMPDTDGAWATSRFVAADDLRHDMHVNIVTFQPGGAIPFPETHVMEHGIYILEGRGVYLLNTEWIEVEAGDFIWLRAFCPQACVARGPGPFRYLLYKDVNRHPRLRSPL